MNPGKLFSTPGVRALFGTLFGASVFAASIGSAQAASFGVRVLDENGRPVTGASVCIGLEGNHKQFGALFTDEAGIARTSVPNVPLVVTVSKTRFSGLRVREPARGFNLIKDVTLVEGVPGPRCRAESALAQASHGSAIRIRDIDISEGVFSKLLIARVSGEPTHYRVATTRDFAGAPWQRYASSIPLTDQLADASTLYVQMRRFVGNARASVESRSDVTTVSLPR